MIDSYGGTVPHGGGAFSGKDPSKVDRSAAYMCRHVAKSIIANEFSKKCLVSVAYEFGSSKPVMLQIKTDNNNDKKLFEFINNKFDFSPKAIEDYLNLRKIKYLPTATYGHFTNQNYPWEKIVSL